MHNKNFTETSITKMYNKEYNNENQVPLVRKAREHLCEQMRPQEPAECQYW